MNIIKFQKENPIFQHFPTLFDDFFNDGFVNKIATGTSLPAVNIKETDSDFKILVAAPGLKKEDFKINLNENVLTIYSEKKEEKEEVEKGKFTRREYSFSSFSRSFTLPGTVQSDAIEAKYENGELILSIPKKEEIKLEKLIEVK